MGYVFVRHDNSCKEYCFEFPEWMAPSIEIGKRVLCNTQRGNTYATVTSNPIYGEIPEQVALRMGITFPLKSILGVEEEVPTSDIDIPCYMSKSMPSKEKIIRRINEYYEYGECKTHVEITPDMTLSDGYTALLVTHLFKPTIKALVREREW